MVSVLRKSGKLFYHEVMKRTITDIDEVNEKLQLIKWALFGAFLITLGSWARIPLYPVPFTLQTLAIFFLGLTQSPKQAFASAACYLFLASVGLPVLGSKINPLWFLGKCAGYLFAFPVAAFVIARVREKSSAILAIFLGQVIIFLFGWIWLLPFLGAKTAFIQGVFVFLPSSVIKAFMALTIVKVSK